MSDKLNAKELIALVMKERGDSHFNAEFDAATATGFQYAERFGVNTAGIIGALRAKKVRAKHLAAAKVQ